MISVLTPEFRHSIESQSNNLHQLKAQPWCYWNARDLGIRDSLRSREFREQIKILQNIFMAPETSINLLFLLIEYLKCSFFFITPCVEIDKNIVPVTGAGQYMSNNWLLLQKLPEAHKVVLCSPSPFNKNTHPLIYLRGSGHQKSESVNTVEGCHINAIIVILLNFFVIVGWHTW